MSKYIVYLIEDRVKNAKDILEKLNKVKTEYCDNEYSFAFELLRGSVPGEYGGEKYSFYDSTVYKQIEQHSEEENGRGNRVGLLLDVLLTQEDIERTSESYYPQVSISRNIFDQFRDCIPIYFITTTSAFGGQSDIIMGQDLSEQYIKQQRLVRDPQDTIKAELDRLFSFYRNFYKNEDIGERDERIENGQQMEMV